MNIPLVKALRAQRALGRHRFHFPSHAGHPFGDGLWLGDKDDIFGWDYTELPPLDVLGNPTGVLRESQTEVARLFGADHSYYLINGASVGLMAALWAAGLDDTSHVLVARNCHRSVIHGLVLTGSQPIWLLPQVEIPWGLWGAVDPEAVEIMLLQYPEIQALVITHPTYEGVASDIQAIASLCRRHNVLLIVDEAHGSLWSLNPHFPVSAIAAGADAVVHSLHKSAGALTQTALLHLPPGSRIAPDRVQQALNLLQTTSPSYPLLANMEATLAHWASAQGQTELAHWLAQIKAFRSRPDIKSLKTLFLKTEPDGLARFQLVVRSSRLDGETLAAQLEDVYDIAFESATPYAVLLSLNMGLTTDDLDALVVALVAIDAESLTKPEFIPPPITFALPHLACAPRQAMQHPGELCPAEDAIGRVSQDLVAACPPGIPLLMPGEIIRPDHLPFLPTTVRVMSADSPVGAVSTKKRSLPEKFIH